MLKGNLIKIAIVEDDEDDYFIITSYIKNIPGTNLHVEWIDNYKTAIDKIKAEAYDIYFIDYRLGNETSDESHQKNRAQRSGEAHDAYSMLVARDLLGLP